LDGNGLLLETINGEAAVGLTGSGLLSAANVLRKAGVIAANGRINPSNNVRIPVIMRANGRQERAIPLTADGRLYLSQWDIRELQKAKGAILATINILMGRLKLRPADLSRVILTGSFGGQIDIEAAREIGLIPPVDPQVIANIPNGAGLGAASFLSAQGWARAQSIAAQAEQIDLDTDPEFIERYVQGMSLDVGQV
jgi:uncharacterized 2Fe-2S/4Fe-4S cluster protein (DUF4445 family)